MEEKKSVTLTNKYSAGFFSLCNSFFLTVFDLPVTFDRLFVQFLHRNCRPFRLFPTFFFWFEWFNYDLFGSCFYQKKKLTAAFGQLLTFGCIHLWRILFACVGNRSLVGWRRIALVGFFTKQRFVTRYNYRRRGHYFWRRNQRRWRLFKTRRRLYFFIRRYKKFRRLRYRLSYHLSWRTQQRIKVLGFRWRGSRMRLFIANFLRWRTYLLRVRLPSGLFYQRNSWRQYTRFLAYRHLGSFFRFRYRRSTAIISKQRRRLWYHKRRRLLGYRRSYARNFNRLRKRPPSWLVKSRKLRRFINRNVVFRRKFLLFFRRRSIIRPFITRLRTRKSRRFRRLRFLKKQKRWARKSWRRRKRLKVLRKFRKRRQRRILRVLRRNKRHRRKAIIAFVKTRKLFRRNRRRIKRRVKRRRKYAPRWHTRVRYSRVRRRRLLRFRRVKTFRWKSLSQFHTRRHVPKSHQFLFYQKPITLPFLAIADLKRLWRRASVLSLTTKRFGRCYREQRVFRAHHLAWNDEEAPRYRRLLHFRRWRHMIHFGRARRWLCSLFINGRRCFYYKERKQPLSRFYFLSRRHTTLSNNSLTLPVLGGRLKSGTSPQRRRYFWRRLRATFQSRHRMSRRKRRFFRVKFRRKKRRFRRLFRRLRRRRFFRKRRWFRKYRLGKRKDSWFLLFKLRRLLFKKFKRRLFLRRFYSHTKLTTRIWVRRLRWHRPIYNIRRRLNRTARRRKLERFLYRTYRHKFIFRLRILQSSRRKFRVRRLWLRTFLIYKKGLRLQLATFIRFRRFRRTVGYLRFRFRYVFFKHLRVRMRYVCGSPVTTGSRRAPYLRLEIFNLRNTQRAAQMLYRPAVLGLVKKAFKRRSSVIRLSRYICPRGAGLFKAHLLLTRRYPSVYDFETFNYLFSSSFLYDRFTQKGNRWRSQIIVMSVLRYLRPYSSFHLVRFIERFLVEGFPIYFELSSLKQSNKEQPFPVPINLAYFRTYMLKAIATRFRARRHAVSFQAALLTELWAWHVDPTLSILHDFLVNHYAVGLDSRFFVHYRWKVKR